MPLEKRKLLVIDDADSFLELVKVSLGEFFEVYEEKEVLNAFSKIDEIHPDLILTDINMPGMDGIELIKELQKDTQKKRIPVIVISASDYNKVSENLLRNQPNVFAFLSKMVPMDALREKIDSILKNR